VLYEELITKIAFETTDLGSWILEVGSVANCIRCFTSDQ